MRIISIIIRCILALIFIFSGFSKLLIHNEFLQIVIDFNILPYGFSYVYGILLPWVELLTGFTLLIGMNLKASAILVILMSLSFIIANVYTIASGTTYCHQCFGGIFDLSAPIALAIDALMVIMAVVLIIVQVKQKNALDLELSASGSGKC